MVRMDSTPNGTQPRMDSTPNGTQPRIDFLTPEWWDGTQHRMDLKIIMCWVADRLFLHILHPHQGPMYSFGIGFSLWLHTYCSKLNTAIWSMTTEHMNDGTQHRKGTCNYVLCTHLDTLFTTIIFEGLRGKCRGWVPTFPCSVLSQGGWVSGFQLLQ